MVEIARKPNVTDLARYPYYPLRYYIMTEDPLTGKTGMYKTHRTTETALRSGFTVFRVVDLIQNKVSPRFVISPYYGKKLLTLWRKYYFDQDYDLIGGLSEEVDPDEE